jgi:DoxX-like family
MTMRFSPKATETDPVSTTRLWAGRIISTLLVLFLLFDGVGKLMKLPPVVEGTARHGYPESLIIPLGITELACTIVYAVPRASFIGAILVTAYLGGATATHVRIGDPFFFPIGFGVLIWGALFLRDHRLRALLPLRGRRTPLTTRATASTVLP